MNRFLLDTHVLLWANGNPEELGTSTTTLLTTSDTTLFVSAVSVLEIAIKRSLGKLRLPVPIPELLIPIAALELPVSIAHAEATESLPALHRDPFDRLLAAQASVEGLTLVTADARLLAYPINTLDARS